MHPRFGIVTQVLAAVLAIAGLGATLAAMSGSSGTQDLILVLLAAVFLIVAVGVWTEFVWAWWAGLAVVLLTIVLSVALNSSVGVGLVWPATLVGFIVSGFQGWKDKDRASSHPAG